MAVIASQSSGSFNWSDTAVWVGGVLPDPVLDSAVIAAGCTITLSDSRTIPPTTVEGSLIQGTGVTTTLGGALTVGNGTAKIGTLTFGAGSELALNGFSIYQNNCKLYSNATSGSWAKVTGTGNLDIGTVYTGVSKAKQDIVLTYVSFQNTGNVLFPQASASSGGTYTQQTDIQHCVFANTGTLTHGTSGVTPYTCPITFEHNDLRDTSTVIFYAIDNAAATIKYIRYNTFVKSTGTTTIAFPRKSVIEGNIFDAYTYTNANGGYEVDITKNLIVHRGGATGSSCLSVSALSVASNNYLYSPSSQLNAHSIFAATGTTSIENNVFELWGTEPNIFNYGVNSSPSITGNIALGNNNISLLTILSNPTTGDVTCTGNTQISGQSTAAGLLLFENSSYGTQGGTLTVSNNLLASNGVSTPALIISNVPANTNNVTTANNNAMPGTDAESFVYIDSIGTKTGNLYGVDPAFVDATRKFTTYGQTIAGTDGTDTALLALFAATNGYNSTTKTQSDTPSGVSVAGSSTSLVDWVKAGFTPTNMTLATAGEGGTFIGAVQPVAAGDPQTITFGALSAVQYGGASFNLTATASSGLAVSYTSSDTGVATVSGSTVTIVGVGSTNITASQAGDETYAAATPVVQALTVNKADQTISISAPSYKLPTDDPFAVTATATSGLTVTLSIVSGPATILNGTVTLTGSLGDVVIRGVQAGNGNHNAAADVDRTVHVVEKMPILSKKVFGFGFKF